MELWSHVMGWDEDLAWMDNALAEVRCDIEDEEQERKAVAARFN